MGRAGDHPAALITAALGACQPLESVRTPDFHAARTPASDATTGLAALIADHRERFHERFGRPGEVRLFHSPGRVNLMGAHLDYNGGPVMPMAIDRGTFVAVRPRGDGRLRLASTLEAGEVETDVAHLPGTAVGAWYDYPLGVVSHLVRGGGAGCGADVLFGGNLPIGAGLSSSASICVGTAYALGTVWGLPSDPQDCIAAALWGEREFVGVRCGIMDPYAVALTRPGHVLWLDCKDASVEHLPLDPDEVTIAVADSGVRRELAQGAFNERVTECARAFGVLRRHVPEAECLRDVSVEIVEEHAGELEPTVLRRARHVASEVQRTMAARAALLAGDLPAFGRRITEAHASLRDCFEVSTPELDLLVDTALSWEGVFGARLTGAGFGGCIVIVLRSAARPGLDEHLRRTFQERVGREPAVAFFRGDRGPREVRP